MFRVDKRQYYIGDLIQVSGTSYQDDLYFTEKKQRIENILEQEKPRNVNIVRNSGLYIFSELSDAIRFCCSMRNSKIYKVTSSNNTTRYHRGDMNWMEVMQQFDENEIVLRQMATLYWNGIKTFKPCWEMLVNEVIVTSVIVQNEEERIDIYREYQNSSGNIEGLNIYRQNLCR